MIIRKPTVRSPLERRPLHEIQQIMAWLTTGGPDGVGIPYDQVVVLCRNQLGFKTSKASLHRLYGRHRAKQSGNHEGRQQPRVDTSLDPVAGTLTVVIHLNR